MDRRKWEEWKALPEGARRRRLGNELTAENTPLVKKFVTRVLWASKIYCEPEEALQAGMVGFHRALDRWDPAKGAFSTFAFFLIRAELQNALRREMPVMRPATFGVPYKQLRAIEAFEAKHGRPPEPEEIGTTAKEWQKWLTGIIHFVPIDERRSSSSLEGDADIAKELADPTEDAETLLTRAEDLSRQRALVAALSDEDRAVLSEECADPRRRETIIARLREQYEDDYGEDY